MASLDEEGDNAIGQKAGGFARFVHRQSDWLRRSVPQVWLRRLSKADRTAMTVDVLFWIFCELVHAWFAGQGYVLRNHQRKRTAATCTLSESADKDAAAIRAVVLIAEVGSHTTAGESGGKRSYEEEANEVVPLCSLVWLFADLPSAAGCEADEKKHVKKLNKRRAKELRHQREA